MTKHDILTRFRLVADYWYIDILFCKFEYFFSIARVGIVKPVIIFCVLQLYFDIPFGDLSTLYEIYTDIAQSSGHRHKYIDTVRNLFAYKFSTLWIF